MRTILSFDGGGVRGAISVAFLKRIEQMLCPDGETKLANKIDLAGGTSTGAIIAGAVALGYSANDIRDFYLKLAPQIFRRPWLRIPILQSKFRSGPLRREIRRICGARTLESDDLLTKFALVMKRMDTGGTWILSNNRDDPFWEDPESGGYVGNRHYRLTDVIRASTAAPHYFAPERIQIIDGALPGLFVDGGVTPHNNPALALFQMVTIPAHKYGWETGADKLRIVSVGTGTFRETLDPKWARWMLSSQLAVKALKGMISDGQTQVMTMMQLLGHNRTPWSINSLVGDLDGVLLPSEPLFDFLRYDVKLEADWLRDELKISVTKRQLESLRAMDDPSEIRRAYDIGTAAAEKFVRPEHFEKA